MSAEEWLTWERIETFLAIIEHGTFTQAASALRVSQPAVSKQILRIEEDLGRRLFDRTKKGAVLTPEGDSYLMFARAMRDVGESARRHFSAPPINERLRLGVADAFARSMLTRILAIFCRSFPEYQIEIVCDANSRLTASFSEDDRLDLLLVDRIRGSDGELLRRARLNWVGASDTRLPISDPIPLIADAEGEPFREMALAALREAGRTWRILFQSSSLAAQMAAAEAGIGICVIGAAVPLHGVVALDAASGLPPLPAVDVVMLGRHRDDGRSVGGEAMQAVVRSIFAQLVHPGFVPVPAI